MSTEIDSNAIVSHEQDGRVLSGVGITSDRLEEVMERHAPPEPAPSAGTEAAAPAVAESGGEPPASPVSTPTRGQKRFSELTRERDEANARTAAAEARAAERDAIARERDELRQRLEQAAPARPQERAEPAAPPAAAAPPFPAFDVWVAQDGNADKDYGDYVDARADHRYELRRNAERQEESARTEESRQRDRVTAYRDALPTVQATYADYDAVIAAGANVSKVMERAALEVGPLSAYLLAKHPDREAMTEETLIDPSNPAFPAAVASMKRYLQTLVAGAQSHGRAAPAARAAVPAWTPPPPPYAPVGASSPTTPTPSSELAKKGFDYDASGYREKRAAERKAGRR